MADLKAVLTDLGATNVATLLNSGNAVFDAKKKLTAPQIRKAVAGQLGVDAAVILKTAAEWAAIAAPHELHLGAQRLLVKLDRLFATTVKEQVGIDLHRNLRWRVGKLCVRAS